MKKRKSKRDGYPGFSVDFGTGGLEMLIGGYWRGPMGRSWGPEGRTARGSAGMPPLKIFEIYACKDAISCIFGYKLLYLDH